MFERFNFYDFYGYFVPGGFLWLALFPLGYAAFVLVTGTAPPVKVGVAESVILLFVAYVTGHLLQTLARYYHVIEDHRDFGTHLLLQGTIPGDPKAFSDPLRLRIHEVISSRLGLPAVTLANVDEQSCRERFQLAYSHVIANRPGSYVEMYNGLYSLYRGLFCVTLLCRWLLRILLIVWLLYHAVGVLIRTPLPGLSQLVAALFLVAAFVGLQYTLEPLRTRFQEFSKNFAKAVCQEMLNLPTPAHGG